MKKILQVRFRARGLGMEKLLNEARKREIRLAEVRREKDRAVMIQCAPGEYRRFLALAREKGYEVEAARPVGALRLMQALGKRKGLLAGAVLCGALLAFAMTFVWQVRVENAGAYAGEVRAYLREIGVMPGMRRADVDLAGLREKLEWRLPRVKWVRTEFSGVALVVRLEEGVPLPPREEEAPGNVVAAEDGILRRLTAYAGTPAARAGDLVRAGQVLIRGEEKGQNGEMIPVKARGEAIARVWVSARVRLPLKETVSLPTGREAERRVLVSPFFSWSAQRAPDYLTCDREIARMTVGGAWVPLVLQRETYWEAALEKRDREAEEVKQEGAKAALYALRQALYDQEMVDKWINFSMIEGDTITVEATAEVIREIGRYQKN